MILDIIGLVIGFLGIGIMAWSFVVFVQMFNSVVFRLDDHDRTTCNCSTCRIGKNNGQELFSMAEDRQKNLNHDKKAGNTVDMFVG